MHRPLALLNARLVDPEREREAPGGVLVVEGRIAALGAGLGPIGVTWRGWIILAALPLALVALAAGAAHIALLFRLGRAP